MGAECGLRAEIVGLLAEIVGLLAEIVGLLADRNGRPGGAWEHA